MDLWSRRKFFFTTLTGSALASASRLFGKSLPGPAPGAAMPAAAEYTATRPVIISSATGLNAVQKGMGILERGGAPPESGGGAGTDCAAGRNAGAVT